MDIFEEREKAFEKAFVHQQETQFRALALRNRMLGEWAAQQMGLRGRDCEAFVDSVASSATFTPVDEPLIERIRNDFEAHGVTGAGALVRTKMSEFLIEANQRLSAPR
jgi:hypothetical protein